MITVAASLLPDNIDIPVVSYFFDDPRFDSLCPDAEINSRMIIEYLCRKGHRKIGYLGWLRDRRVKFLIAEAARCGMEFHERWQIGAVRSFKEDLFQKFMEKNRGQDLPTALVIHNDDLALKIIHSIREYAYSHYADTGKIAPL